MAIAGQLTMSGDIGNVRYHSKFMVTLSACAITKLQALTHVAMDMLRMEGFEIGSDK